MTIYDHSVHNTTCTGSSLSASHYLRLQRHMRRFIAVRQKYASFFPGEAKGPEPPAANIDQLWPKYRYDNALWTPETKGALGQCFGELLNNNAQ